MIAEAAQKSDSDVAHIVIVFHDQHALGTAFGGIAGRGRLDRVGSAHRGQHHPDHGTRIRAALHLDMPARLLHKPIHQAQS